MFPFVTTIVTINQVFLLSNAESGGYVKSEPPSPDDGLTNYGEAFCGYSRQPLSRIPVT
jgi:hypothetical protein